MDGSDWSCRTEELRGRLCWYREPPLLRGIVRVEDARRDEDRLETTLCVLASATRRPEHDLEPGKVYTVRASLTSEWNQLWLIHPLDATTLDAAIAEVEAEYKGAEFRWRRSDGEGT